MTEAVEVAIELALSSRAQAFAASLSLPIALSNINFTPPAGNYLRMTFLPADTATLCVGSGSDQHYGILQLDVFSGVGIGEIAPGRIAAEAISYFKRDTLMTSDGFDVRVSKTPYRGPQIRDGSWTFIPVRIPYNTFASPA